jgi:ERF superfamily
MTEAKTGLWDALASFQASLPKVGKEGEGQYGKYAQLPDVNQVILPALAALGVSFSAKPTITPDGFVLHYKFEHSPSGDKDEGDYLLPDPVRVGSQATGGAITYARRQIVLAWTGVAPAGDDDDGQQSQRAVDENWRSQPPVQRQRYAHTDAAHERLVPGQSAEDRANGKKADRVKGKAPDDEWTTPAETDQDWYGRIQADIKTFKTDVEGEVLRRRMVEKTEAGGCTKEDADKLRTLIRARRQALAVEFAAQVPAEETADA